MGRESKIWITLEAVVRECPELETSAFKGYLFKTPGRTVAQRGFDLMTYRDKLSHAFIHNHAAEEDASNGVIGIATWKDFEALYIQSYEARPGDFILGMLEERSEHRFKSGAFTYASTVFGLDAASQRTVRGDISSTSSTNSALMPLKPAGRDLRTNACSAKEGCSQ